MWATAMPAFLVSSSLAILKFLDPLMPLYPLVTALLTTGASVGGTLSEDHSRKKRNNYIN